MLLADAMFVPGCWQCFQDCFLYCGAGYNQVYSVGAENGWPAETALSSTGSTEISEAPLSWDRYLLLGTKRRLWGPAIGYFLMLATSCMSSHHASGSTPLRTKCSPALPYHTVQLWKKTWWILVWILYCYSQ